MSLIISLICVCHFNIRYTGIYGTRIVRRGIRWTCRHILLWHVCVRDAYFWVSLQRVLQPGPNIQESYFGKLTTSLPYVISCMRIEKEKTWIFFFLLNSSDLIGKVAQCVLSNSRQGSSAICGKMLRDCFKEVASPGAFVGSISSVWWRWIAAHPMSEANVQ